MIQTQIKTDEEKLEYLTTGVHGALGVEAVTGSMEGG